MHLSSFRMRQLLQPAQSFLAGSQSSEAPGKRWLPRDVHCGGIEELEGQRVVELPLGIFLRQDTVSPGRQSEGQHILARASQWPLEKPCQAAVELKLRYSRAPCCTCSTSLLLALLDFLAGKASVQALAHIWQLATCSHFKSCPSAQLAGPGGASVATRASQMLVVPEVRRQPGKEWSIKWGQEAWVGQGQAETPCHSLAPPSSLPGLGLSCTFQRKVWPLTGSWEVACKPLEYPTW